MNATTGEVMRSKVLEKLDREIEHDTPLQIFIVLSYVLRLYCQSASR